MAAEDGRAGSAAPISGKVAASTSPPKSAVKCMPVAEFNNSPSTTGTTSGSRGDMEEVCVGTAEPTSTPTAIGAAVVTAEAGGSGGPFKFFQSCDGQKTFLHPLNMRQLLDDFEKDLPLPERIDAKVWRQAEVPFVCRRLVFGLVVYSDCAAYCARCC